MRLAPVSRRCLLAAAIVLPGSSVWADDKPADARTELFKQLDKNGDGQVAADEVNEEQQRLFKRLLQNDKNQDGKLSQEEWLAGTQEDRPARRAEGNASAARGGDAVENARREADGIFAKLDANKDGKVELSEVPEERRERFAQMIERADANGDKALTLEEFIKGILAARGGQAAPGNPQPMPGGLPGDGLARLLDSNGDGKLSADEIGAASEALKKLDRDGDGTLTRDEIGGAMVAKFGGQPPGVARVTRVGGFGSEQMLAFWKQADKNGDGKWSKEEVPEWAKTNFDRLDSNGDGSIDAEELKKMAEGFARMAAQAGGFGGGEMLARVFEGADANKDGKLSKDEAPERMKENFERLDQNKDGFIDRDELRQGMAQMIRRKVEEKK